MSHLLLSSLALLALASTAFAQHEPARVAATFDRIYVPGGYDSNDHIQLVGEGRFRNTCYRPAPSRIQIDGRTRSIYVGPVAYEYSGLCLQVVLPFERVIDIGILKAGTWRIFQDKSPSAVPLGEVTVHPALTDIPDDHLYAPVTQAFFEQKGMVNHFYLAGEFQTNCMNIEDIKITIEKEAIVLQPLLKAASGESCEVGRFPFLKKLSVPFIPKGRYLLHVRSMNGNAVNTLISVQ